MRLQVFVEGQGDQLAMPALITRLLDDSGLHAILPVPIIVDRGLVVKRDTIEVKLKQVRLEGSDAALFIFDADKDCAVELAKTVLSHAREVASDLKVGVTVADRKYEHWLQAGGIDPVLLGLSSPTETHRRFLGYKKTIHQKLYTSQMDLEAALVNSRSLQKLAKTLDDLLRVGNGR